MFWRLKRIVCRKKMSTEILSQFKTQIIKFLDEMVEQFPNEGDFVVMRILIKDQYSINDVMNNFIQQVLPLKQMVKDRNDKFFLENNILFEDLDSTKVNHFKTVWRSDSLDDDDRQAMWLWFDLFIKLAEKYQRSI